MRSVILALLLVTLVALPTLDQAKAGDKDWEDWNFVVGLYLPLTNMSGDISVASPTGGEADLPVELRFGDIADNWKGGFAGVFALKKKRWSFNFDMLYVKLEKDQQIPALVQDWDVTTGLSIGEYELFVGYQISDPDQGVSEIIFGTRYFDQKLNLSAQVAEATFSETPTSIDEQVTQNWWMGFLGARYLGPLAGSEKWKLLVRADVGAFDTSGRITWRADLGAIWSFAKHWDLGLKYKWLGVDYKNGMPGDSDYYYYKAVEHGPVIGIGIRF
jgi:hypothetical protein